ncbi:MAG: hypothetical protein JWM05_152 [Acidimicrobiales bacterium]|nr:hypothetical protein [Acidimicrobiales bacterium]
MACWAMVAAVTCAAAGASLALGGCRSGGGRATITARHRAGRPPLSKAAYLRRANAICRAAEAQVTSRTRNVDMTDPVVLFTTVTKVIVPVSRRQLADLRSLGYPAGDRARLQVMFAEYAKVLDAAEKDPERLFAANPALDVADESLATYGLTACASR